MNRKRYITDLSENEQKALQQVVKTGTTHRERQRAQAILWSNQGKDMATLLDWLQVDRDTLSSWFTRRQTLGIRGLKDKPKSGRKKEDYARRGKKTLLQAQAGIVNGKQFTAQVNQWLGKKVSWWPIKALLKQAGFSYRRVRKSLESSRDKLMFDFFAQEIKQLQELTQIDLWFYDESSFDLNPACVYAWQAKGSKLTLPAQRGNVLTVAGFIKTDNSFEGYYQQGSMDQDLFIAYIEELLSG